MYLCLTSEYTFSPHHDESNMLSGIITPYNLPSVQSSLSYIYIFNLLTFFHAIAFL